VTWLIPPDNFSGIGPYPAGLGGIKSTSRLCGSPR
jgi:hypothetical protein